MNGYDDSFSDPTQSSGYGMEGLGSTPGGLNISAIIQQLQQLRNHRIQQQQGQNNALSGVAKAIAQMKMQTPGGTTLDQNTAPPADNPDQVTQTDAVAYLQSQGMDITPQNIQWVLSGGNQSNG